MLYDPELVNRPAALADVVGDARALVVRNRTQVTRDLIAAAPALKCIGRLGVGLDNIDLEACEARGVTVYPATGANDASVAEYVIATAMMLLRTAYRSNDAVIAGTWPRNQLMGREIEGKTLGLVGFGNIARHTARLARALGVRTIAHDPYVPADNPVWRGTENVSPDTLLATADIVSLHVPLTPQTRGMIGDEAIAKMKRDAILINAARGGIVDEAAMVAALKDGRLGGAALDVYETEPLTAEAGALFAGVPNLVLTPHIAGVTAESNVRVSSVTVKNVLSHLDGLS